MASRDQRRQKSDKKTDTDKTLPAENRKRHPFVYFGSVILLVIIVVAFVGGPLLRGRANSGPIVFGTYDGEEITYTPGNYLARQVEVLSDQLQNTSSSQSYEYQMYQVWKGAYDRTVLRTAMLSEAENSGVFVSDNQIDQLLLTSGPYMENGVFSETRYNNTSNSERYRYRNLYRDEYTQQLFLQDTLHYGISSSKEAEFVKGMASQERSFDYVVFDYPNFPAESVAQYANENIGQFRRMKISRITVKSSREEAEAVRKQIVDGVATFEDQARNFSSDAFAEDGGDMGWRTFYSLIPDFANTAEVEALFLLNKDDISGVFDTSFGWTIYRADEAAENPDIEDPDTLEQVRIYMERFERGLIEDTLTSEAQKFAMAANEQDFDAAADQYALDVLTTGSFPVNYGNNFYFGAVQGAEGSSALSNAAFDETLLTMLFSLKQDEVSEPIVLTDSVGVFRLAEEKTLPEEDVKFLGDYFASITQQNIEQDLNAYLLESGAFVDHFTEVFSQRILAQ